jgi:hypothetical protein
VVADRPLVRADERAHCGHPGRLLDDPGCDGMALAEAMRESMGSTVLHHAAAEQERGVTSAREALGEEGFETAWTEGRTMTPQQRTTEAFR